MLSTSNLFLIILALATFHSGTLINGEIIYLNIEINTLLCNILYFYLGFLIFFYVLHKVILKGDKLKKSHPLLYNILILLAFGFLYSFHQLSLKIISLIVKNI